MKPDNQAPMAAPESLDTLAAEAAADAPQPEAMPAGEIVQPITPDAGLVMACKGIVAVVGGLVCARAGAEALRAEEVEAVGTALAGVAVFYLPTGGDPRVMAWMTLALALGAVAAPRVRKARDADAAG